MDWEMAVIYIPWYFFYSLQQIVLLGLKLRPVMSFKRIVYIRLRTLYIRMYTRVHKYTSSGHSCWPRLHLTDYLTRWSYLKVKLNQRFREKYIFHLWGTSICSILYSSKRNISNVLSCQDYKQISTTYFSWSFAQRAT